MLSVAFATIAEKEKQKIEKKTRCFVGWLGLSRKYRKIGCTAKYVLSNSLRIAPTVQFPPATLQATRRINSKMVLVGE